MGNTGYKSFTLLERYYTDDDSPTGETKPNTVTDPDYIAPVLDTISCPASARYYNTQQTKTVTKNNCAVGTAGTTATLTAYANQFVSNESIADANNQALNWLEDNAQIYANNKGSCELSSDTIPPAAPILNSALGNNQTTINLSWNIPSDNIGVTAYEIYKKANEEEWYMAFSINTPSTISFSDINQSPHTTFYYKIRARDAASNWSDFSNVTYQTTRGDVNCFVKGTLISLPDGTTVPIESLVINQFLLSAAIETLNDTNILSELHKWSSEYLSENRITSPVTRIEPKIAYKTIIINEGLLEATPSHCQLIQRNGIWKFILLQDVIVGDKLYNSNKEIIPITSIAVNLEKRDIYPLTLSPSHTYFANGILTHNKETDPIGD